MTTVRLTLEYDGTAYAGWQIQPNGLSVQQVVEDALARVVGEPVRLHSSGRTDAGVHALGMVAHFQTGRALPLSAYREGVNRFLPRDVAVTEAAIAPEGFHARFSARGKWYRYIIYQGPVRSPLRERTSWHIRSALDVAAMALGARSMVGRHDFAAFRSSSCEARTSIREIFSLEILPHGDLLFVDVKGSGFLKNMVRIMVGTLVEIGMGKRSVRDVETLLREGRREGAGCTAPAQGLCLKEVWYETPGIEG